MIDPLASSIVASTALLAKATSLAYNYRKDRKRRLSGLVFDGPVDEDLTPLVLEAAVGNADVLEPGFVMDNPINLDATVVVTEQVNRALDDSADNVDGVLSVLAEPVDLGTAFGAVGGEPSNEAVASEVELEDSRESFSFDQCELTVVVDDYGTMELSECGVVNYANGFLNRGAGVPLAFAKRYPSLTDKRVSFIARVGDSVIPNC